MVDVGPDYVGSSKSVVTLLGIKLRGLATFRIFHCTYNHVRFKYYYLTQLPLAVLLFTYTYEKARACIRASISWYENDISLYSRPPTREPTSTSSGTSRLTVTSETSALATALQTALNSRTGPTRSQSQPVDLAVPTSTQQQAHAWHSQPAAFRRGEYRSG